MEHVSQSRPGEIFFLLGLWEHSGGASWEKNLRVVGHAHSPAQERGNVPSDVVSGLQPTLRGVGAPYVGDIPRLP